MDVDSLVDSLNNLSIVSQRDDYDEFFNLAVRFMGYSPDRAAEFAMGAVEEQRELDAAAVRRRRIDEIRTRIRARAEQARQRGKDVNDLMAQIAQMTLG